MVRADYDETCDMAYIYIEEADKDSYDYSVPLDGKLSFATLDISKDGRLIGIEISNASRRLPLKLIETLQNIVKARKEPRDFLAPGC